MKDYAFEIEMKVRDYECDLQGVVNNSNYQHYMEHARHEFLETTGTSFSALHDQGIDVMVSRIDISYKHSLRGSDRFVVQVAYQREGIKLYSSRTSTNSPKTFYAPKDESRPFACKTVNLPEANCSKPSSLTKLKRNKNSADGTTFLSAT